MEARLKMLQERMQVQQLEAEATSKTGGTRWRSSKVEKGSIRAYGKDVVDKHKKRSEFEASVDPTLRISSSLKQNSKQPPPLELEDNYANKGINVIISNNIIYYLMRCRLLECKRCCRLPHIYKFRPVFFYISPKRN